MDRKKVEEHRENGWKAIDGKRLKSEPVGFCNNKVHRGWLSTALLKGHKCLEKQCSFLDRNNEHPFWVQRKRLKIKSSLSRILREAYIDGAITNKSYLRLCKVLNRQKTKEGLIMVCHMIQKRDIFIPEKIYYDLIDGAEDF